MDIYAEITARIIAQMEEGIRTLFFKRLKYRH